MADPVYFHRLPIPAHETCDQARGRLAYQVEIHRQQRAQAKDRALREGFPGITADTPVEPLFATWDGANADPIHRFLLAEIGRVLLLAAA